MIVLIAAFAVFFFLVVGSIAFLACIMIPAGRKYALSTALWFAMWGPCCVLFLILVVLGVVAGGLALQAAKMQWEDAPRLLSAAGWVSIVAGVVATCAIASIAAWIHQKMIHRFTFALFRIYAMLVSGGIGCTLGLFTTLSATVKPPFPHAAVVAMVSIPTLTAIFGAIAYKHAGALRGNAPSRFTWITQDEFAGTADSAD